MHKSPVSSPQKLNQLIRAALGQLTCDLVIKNVQFLDVYSGEFVHGDVAILDGIIVGTGEAYAGIEEVDGTGKYLVPGFIDAHVHIESSLMIPQNFAKAVLSHGTTTVFWDPHEIANVKGEAGIQWALEASEGLDLDVFVMLPSCVPSTSPHLNLETSGFQIDVHKLKAFAGHPRVVGLAEMMNFPGLLGGAPDVLDKLHLFRQKPRDGHCPGLSGRALSAYAAAGICTCHESTTLSEAQEKLRKGIHVWIREGSCAKDADALLPLLTSYSSAVVGFCSDDRNPFDIKKEGHINFILNKALKTGISAEVVFRAASYSVAQCYGFKDRGFIAPGGIGDIVLIDKISHKDQKNWENGFKIIDVFKNGKRFSNIKSEENKDQKRLFYFGGNKNINVKNFNINSIQIQGDGKLFPVIEVIENKIVTKMKKLDLVSENNVVQNDIKNDVIKIVVVERHQGTGRIGKGYISGFGIHSGAIATTVNHDSHNIIAVGSDDKLIKQAIDKLIDIDGGIVVTDGAQNEFITLEVGGLMTASDPEFISDRLEHLKNLAKQIGCKIHEPFLTLSFMALPVIPEIKITDRGIVDVFHSRIIMQ